LIIGGPKMGKRINEMIWNGANVLFLCLANDSFWPVADTQVHEIMVVRAAASDSKRTIASQLIFRRLPTQCSLLASLV
jgi:hypothetical protein